MIEMSSVYCGLLSYSFFVCCFIPFWVFFLMSWLILTGRGVSFLGDENNFLELVWTVVPTGAVFILCLFNVSSMIVPLGVLNHQSVLITGNQWYWTYLVEAIGESYDSVMSDFIDCVDKPLRLVYNTPYEFLVTSADVIHSFAIPEYNVKLDGIPGRVNNYLFFPDRVGVFVGYCSELCGAGHAYMPIVLEVIHKKLVA